ncbi:hypothetical protein BDN72DRAFT_413426 [Pluteus cervinus]|uniref:Uncharacterized protein n=1 Tax=Pluteus cervinus TaxID=181527 RepID=A0ACD3A8E1_9AGAR|nr:hypothetical protein BDN72DRAFT_413426 [Pluteus cervinus]
MKRKERESSVATDIVTTEEVEQEVREKLAAERRKAGKARQLSPSAQHAELLTRPTQDGEEEHNLTTKPRKGINASAAEEAAEEPLPNQHASDPKLAAKESVATESEDDGTEARNGTKRTKRRVIDIATPTDDVALLMADPASSAGPSSLTTRIRVSDPIQMKTKGEKRKREEEDHEPEPEQTGNNKENAERQLRRSKRSKRVISR